MPIKFEWDDRKAYSNKRKHGITFEIAAKVFLDQHRIEIYDNLRSSYLEDRYITIGYAEEIIMVAYTIRKDRIRIISARLADQDERRFYYDHLL